MLGRPGNVLLVNGRPRPIAQVRAGERQRWRFVNAANARYFRLSVPGQKLTLIGVDGSLLEAPREGNPRCGETETSCPKDCGGVAY